MEEPRYGLSFQYIEGTQESPQCGIVIFYNTERHKFNVPFEMALSEEQQRVLMPLLNGAVALSLEQVIYKILQVEDGEA